MMEKLHAFCMRQKWFKEHDKGSVCNDCRLDCDRTKGITLAISSTLLLSSLQPGICRIENSLLILPHPQLLLIVSSHGHSRPAHSGATKYQNISLSSQCTATHNVVVLVVREDRLVTVTPWVSLCP